MNLRAVHRGSALVVGTFALLHIANHLVALAGADAHRAVMEALRHAYRLPAVEALLLAAVAVQAGTGWWMFFRHWRSRHGWFAWVQAASGLALSGFLLLHVAAIAYGRITLDLDTNLFYAAAGMQSAQAMAFFAPYYFTGVLALFVHVGCALVRLRQRRAKPGAAPVNAGRMVGIAGGIGATVAVTLVLLLAGAIVPLDVPQKYLATFQR